MTQAELITAVLAATPDRHSAIIRATRGEKRRRPILPREAAEILGVHRRTLQRYERVGFLHAIKLSSRKIRYDAEEVERLAANGARAIREDFVALREEIEARLAELEPPDRAHGGIPVLTRAVGTLLRCQRAQLKEREDGAKDVPADALLVGLVEVVKQALGR